MGSEMESEVEICLSPMVSPKGNRGCRETCVDESLVRLSDAGLAEETALLKAGRQKHTGVCKPSGGTTAARVFTALWPPGETVARYLCYWLSLKANGRYLQCRPLAAGREALEQPLAVGVGGVSGRQVAGSSGSSGGVLEVKQREVASTSDVTLSEA